MKLTMGHSFHFIVPAILLLLALQTITVSGGDIYKWIDKDGTVHMTDNPASIPPEYQNQLVKKTIQPAPESEINPEPTRKAGGENTTGTSSSLKHIQLTFNAFEGSARRIIIPVTFNNSVTANLLLDTGAPGLTISPKIADRLGLIKEEYGNLRIMTGGIGSMVPAMLAIVDTVSVGDARADFLPATITPIPSDAFEGLVGMDFMASYRISIDNDNHVLTFDELPPQTERPGGHDEAWWRSHFRGFSKLRDDWDDYLKEVTKTFMTSSEADKVLRVVRSQSTEADRIYRQLESYAREKAVPIAWRH
jgi:hypothetical protein